MKGLESGKYLTRRKTRERIKGQEGQKWKDESQVTKKP